MRKPSRFVFLLFALCSCDRRSATQPASATAALLGNKQVGNSRISAIVDCRKDGLTMTSLVAGGTSYLGAPASLFKFSLDNGATQDGFAGDYLQTTNCTLNGDNTVLTIAAQSTLDPLAFNLTISADGESAALIVATQVTYQGSDPTAFFRMVLPRGGTRAGRASALARPRGRPMRTLAI